MIKIFKYISIVLSIVSLIIMFFTIGSTFIYTFDFIMFCIIALALHYFELYQNKKKANTSQQIEDVTYLQKETNTAEQVEMIKKIDIVFQNQKNKINIKRNNVRTYKIIISVFLLLLFAVLAFSATYLINLAFCKEKPYIESTTEYRLATKTRRVLKTNSVCYITDNGECFHKDNCAYLTNNAEKTTMVEASNKGYRPCSKCWPNPAELYKEETYEEEEPVIIENERTKMFNYYPQIAIPISILLLIFYYFVRSYITSGMDYLFKEKYDKEEKEAFNYAKNKINTIIKNNPTINTDEIQSIIQKYTSP